MDNSMVAYIWQSRRVSALVQFVASKLFASSNRGRGYAAVEGHPVEIPNQSQK